jgi:hypothetical protein
MRDANKSAIMILLVTIWTIAAIASAVPQGEQLQACGEAFYLASKVQFISPLVDMNAIFSDRLNSIHATMAISSVPFSTELQPSDVVQTVIYPLCTRQ